MDWPYYKAISNVPWPIKLVRSWTDYFNNSTHMVFLLLYKFATTLDISSHEPTLWKRLVSIMMPLLVSCSSFLSFLLFFIIIIYIPSHPCIARKSLPNKVQFNLMTIWNYLFIYLFYDMNIITWKIMHIYAADRIK